MQITSNFNEIAAEIDKAAQQFKKKLENMVAGFASEVALIAYSHTAIASQEFVNRWYSLYKQRQDDYGIPITPGYHAGAWQYTEGVPSVIPAVRSPQQVQTEEKTNASRLYQLGQTFTLGAAGFAFEYLESRDKIGANVAQDVIAYSYKTDLVKYYNAV